LTTTLKYWPIREANIYLNMSTKACFARSDYPERTDNELLVMDCSPAVVRFGNSDYFLSFTKAKSFIVNTRKEMTQ